MERAKVAWDICQPRLAPRRLATQVQNGILGDVAFDPSGDLVEGPMTILRFSGRDFVVDRVVRVRPPAAP